jgi:hypothetical protein
MRPRSPELSRAASTTAGVRLTAVHAQDALDLGQQAVDETEIDSADADNRRGRFGRAPRRRVVWINAGARSGRGVRAARQHRHVDWRRCAIPVEGRVGRENTMPAPVGAGAAVTATWALRISPSCALTLEKVGWEGCSGQSMGVLLPVARACKSSHRPSTSRLIM